VTDELLALARSTFAMLGMENVIDRVGRDRFSALAWGCQPAIDDLSRWLRHASYDKVSYISALERITGRLAGMPPRVARAIEANAAAFK
jgi:hypothetical protein